MTVAQHPRHSSLESISTPDFCVRAQTNAVRERARAVALRLGCAFVENPPDSGAGLLVSEARFGLELPGFAKPLWIDAASVEIRRRAAAGRGLHLIRACGERVSQLRVLDATAGLGRDGFTLAWSGAEVVLMERNPLLALLLEDALVALTCAPVQPSGRLSLQFGDARELLVQTYRDHDVIYLDPMFGADAAGLPQRALQMLAALDEGQDASNDGDALLAAALELRPARIVVKRGRRQPPLLADGPSPHHAIVGKRIRFDVYQASGAPAA